MTNDGKSRTLGGHGVQYALELYLSHSGQDALPDAAARAEAAAARLRRLGTPVYFLRSIFMPGDEVCFLLFEGPSSEAVAETGRSAAISFDRVIEVEMGSDQRSQAGDRSARPRESAGAKAREADHEIE